MDARMNSSDEMMYSPSIASKEITMSRKMWFVKMSEIRDAE
jgi:hypothetical protein